jgi:signal transduction histidine kinase
MRRGMNLGADDYLAKPFTAPQLYSAVEARLKKALLLRQTAEKKLSDLRANLSLALPHEMITPLNGIFGLAQILSTGADSLSPAEVAEFGTNILQSAERLHRTVQNFLLYGQLEMKATDAERLATLVLKQTRGVRRVIEDRARRCAESVARAADLQLELADGSVCIAQDLFTKLVDELIDNAFKFSATGTPVRICAVPNGAKFVLSVSDRGRGMDARQIAAIGAYAQFNRKTQEQQGSGLGLTIAKRIVELHAGQFDIQSEPGAGTTISVKLPTGAVTVAA